MSNEGLSSSSELLFIVGPTASGKSDLAMQIAKEYNGEIICADSQTLRRGMNIGTAKPSKEDQAAIPHHMLDIIDPYDRFTVSEFKDRAEVAIADIHARGHLPVVVGGTGLYIDALLYCFSFRKSSSVYNRAELEAMSVGELQSIVTESGYAMPENVQNPRHLIRVIESEGQVPEKQPIRDGAIVVGIDPGKDKLEARIKARVGVMMQSGLLDEYDTLIATHGRPPLGFDAVEYRIIDENHGADMDELTQKLLIGDRRYAKKQRSWLRRNTDIVWFDNSTDAAEHIQNLL